MESHIDVQGLDCAEALEGGPCPGCDAGDCLVLATVRNWQPGFAFHDMPAGLSDPLADAAAKIARLDNREGRIHLASTRAIQTLLECLMSHPVAGIKGDKGDKGDPGKDGTDGQDGKDGQDGEDGKDGIDGIDGQDGKDGQDGLPGNPFDPTLAHICSANWRHAEKATLADLSINGGNPSLIVSFDKEVKAGYFSPQNIIVEARTQIEDPFGPILIWRQLRAEAIQPLQMKQECTLDIKGIGPDGGGNCTGVRYLFNDAQDIEKRVNELQVMLIRVRIIGDLIPDKSLRGLDANHLPKIDGNGNPYWIGPPGGDPYVTGDGIAGGTFESWFELVP